MCFLLDWKVGANQSNDSSSAVLNMPAFSVGHINMTQVGLLKLIGCYHYLSLYILIFVALGRKLPKDVRSTVMLTHLRYATLALGPISLSKQWNNFAVALKLNNIFYSQCRGMSGLLLFIFTLSLS